MGIPWISVDTSVDIPMDIHKKYVDIIWIWIGNFISTASLSMTARAIQGWNVASEN